MMQFQKICLAIFISLFLVLPASATTLHLSIAASMTDATKDLVAAFTTKHPDAKIISNFASSGSLARQIEQGAPADIYISANPKWMTYLQEKDLIASETARTFVFNSLVFIGSQENKGVTIGDLGRFERIALGNPQSVPAGQYAQTALTNFGIYDTLSSEHKLIFSKDVRQALLYADRGEVDGAFVYKTDALIAQNAQILFTVSTDLYPRVSYPIALTKMGNEKPMAKEFFEFTATDEATAIIQKYGFESQ